MTTYADAKIALADLLVTGGRGRITPPLLNENLVLVLDALADAVLSKAGGTMTGPIVLAGAPTTDLHPATKAYVDAVAAGLDPKASVKCGTTANITLSGEQTIDGVLTSASRVLVKNQSTASQNGIYVSAAGAWTRAQDMDSWAEVPGSWVIVEEGSTLADSGWVSTANSGGTLGTTDITWSQITSPGAGVTTFAGRSGAVSPANDDYAVTQLAAIAANSFVGNNTGASARPIVLTVAQVKTLLALVVADVTGAASLAGNQTLTGGFVATEHDLGTVTTGTVTPAPANGQMQKLTANGAFTLAPPSASGSYTIVIDITNGASAGTITTSGFTKVAGDSFTTTNGHKFKAFIAKGATGTLLSVQAMQ